MSSSDSATTGTRYAGLRASGRVAPPAPGGRLLLLCPACPPVPGAGAPRRRREGLGAHGSISVRAGSARRPSTRRPAPRGPLMPAAVCAQACMKMDETLYHVADKIKNFAVMYVARPIFDAFCRARARARTARLRAEPSPCSPAPRRVGTHEERRTSL